MCKDHGGAAPARAPARRAGWSVRETERRAKEGGKRAAAEKAPIVLHPDLAEALGAAEDALSAALGREVRVRKTARGFRVEFELDEPREARRARRARARADLAA